MNLRTLVSFCGTFALLASAAGAQTFVESFDGGSNVGGWTYFGQPEAIQNAGGNPGPYLRSQVDTFAPRARTTDPNSVFCGDWRAKNVRTIGCDLITFSTQFPADRELSLVLTNDAGTPGDPNDDVSVYYVSAIHVPQPGAGWRQFDLAIDPASPTLPPAWGFLGPAPNGDAAWNQVIQDVDQVMFFYGDPTFFFIFDIWVVGLDNPRISTLELPANYCTTKINSQGCPPVITWVGVPSVSNAGILNFLIGAQQVINQSTGTLIYGFAPNFVPFQGGTLCVSPPVRRTPVQDSGGNAGGPDCSGSYSFNFNLWIHSGVDPALTVGQDVFVQWWYRDAGAPSGSGLSDGGRFEIQP